MFRRAREEAAGFGFQPTSWHLVRLAIDATPAERARAQAAHALNELCRIYRAPILAYLQHCAHTCHDPVDVAQEFLALRVTPGLLRGADPQKGRLRTLLLVALKNFLRDLADRERAEKRGGKIKFVPLDDVPPPCDEAASRADLWFDLRWAEAVVERALVRLRRHFAARGEETGYEILLPFLTEAAGGVGLENAACRLCIGPNAFQARVSRLRALYAGFIRQEISRTVSRPEEIEGEISYLISVLAAARRL